MSIMEVRLFELRVKGDRLDEINAEEILYEIRLFTLGMHQSETAVYT
jgi:hypothetical protein